MGRKKRPAQHEIPPPPPIAAAFDAHGRPLPPPLPAPISDAPPPSKRPREEEESYLVKKYRPDSYYRSIESFTKYTKSHRMFDASYVRWTSGGETEDKPHVFGIRIAGTFLSWGRGKTRDAAIDASIRAAFALVAAHGYDDFTLSEDCFTEEPQVSALAPPPPPPPPPPGMPPPGLFGQVAPNFPPPPDMLIPMPEAPKAELAVPSSVGGEATAIGTLGSSAPVKPITLEMPSANNGEKSEKDSKKKGNATKLVFSGEDVDEKGEELSMEEVRMRVPRYWNMISRVMEKKKGNDKKNDKE
ncbi:hypothetical protein ACHAXN_011987 [Cyclotella atomus]